MARAIAAKDAKRTDGPDLYEINPGTYLGLARAALQAIREPTVAIAEAGNMADYDADEGCCINRLNHDPTGDRPATAIVFTAMIDAILAERA